MKTLHPVEKHASEVLLLLLVLLYGPVGAASLRDDHLGSRPNHATLNHNPFGPLNLDAGKPPRPAIDVRSATKAAPAKKQVKLPESPPPPPAPPAPPVAPPLPFVAVGAISGPHVTDGKSVAFVRLQDQLFVLRVGDSIGQTYRVESITSRAVEFSYLPLMQRQSLPLAP